MTTIAKNSRRIRQLKAELTQCTVHRESSQYAGHSCAPVHAWHALRTWRRARLTDNGQGTYTIAVHAGLWYELSRPAAPAGDPPVEGGS